MILWYLDNDISCCMRMLYSSYVVLFTLVYLQSQCMGQVSEPVNIGLGNVLKLVNDKRRNSVHHNISHSVTGGVFRGPCTCPP